MRQPPSSTLLLQLITLLLSISLSISRLHDPTIPTILNQQQQQSPAQLAASSSSINNKVPSIRQTIELAHLSSLVYYFRNVKAHDCTPFNDILHWFSAQSKLFRTDDATYKCHLYEQDAQDTQVIVISRTAFTNSTTTTGADDEEEDSLEDYVAVVYAGTDDFKTFLTDAHVRMTKFGPAPPSNTSSSSNLQPFIDGIPSGVNVHAGFNNAVFGYDLMERVLDAVTSVMEVDRTNNDNEVERKVLTTGHSLGGADSVLCAVVLSYYFTFVTSVSVGCPKTGNGVWRGYVNSIPNVAVWRVVNKLDLVPRMPDFRFKHAGHTIQLGHKVTKAYYHHDGDSDLGYRGVPFNWSASSYFLAPIAGYDHLIGQYIKYLTKKCLSDEDKYYVNRFERITDGDYEEEEVDERIDGEYGDTEVDDSQREMTRQFFLELEADGKMQMKDNESKMIIQISNESAEYGEEEIYAQHYSKRITDNKMTTLEIS